MTHFDTHDFLRKNLNYTDEYFDFGSFEVFNYSFHSKMSGILPGGQQHFCVLHNRKFPSADPYNLDIGNTDETLRYPDSEIKSNKEFRYHIFKPKGIDKAKDIIILLHGFNEKYWDKYLPWAKKLVEDTGKTVILFPMAFHMNRAPQEWSGKKSMFELSLERKKLFPNIVGSSLSNVAISSRLHSMPQRFIWSGLQSYYDVIQLVEECKQGNHPIIESDASFDFFSYSIGGLLAEVIKLADYKEYFSKSKLCIFCGGAVFNRLSPVSKFILDSEANVSLFSYLVEHISSHMKNYEKLSHYLNPDHPEGYSLYCMLDYKVLREYREKQFRQLENQILAVSLKNDYVVPSYEIMNTLQGANRDINIPVEVYDFRYPYSHENPFPLNEKIMDEVDTEFRKIFDRISGFLC